MLKEVEGRYSFKLRFLMEKMLLGEVRQRATLTDIESAIQNESFEQD